MTKPKEHLTAIGVCKWGSVKDVETLTDTQHGKKKVRLMFDGNISLILVLFSFLKKSMAKANAMNYDEETKKREKGERDLEMNHSHYLMLDDGTIRYYEIGDFRTRLCKQLAKLEVDDSIPSKYFE